MNYHYEISGPDLNVFKHAFKKCISLAMDNGSRQMGIALHGKRKLDAPLVVKVLGKSVTEGLKKNNIVDLQGFKIYLITERIDPPTDFGGPILAPHVSLIFLTTIRAILGATDIVYVPWTKDELKKYVSTYTSTKVGM